ncbi:hypothetical protein SPFL3102_01874 [Sporomusaceae bacterium FL31]|nr:hypothetical protein SPFL3101_03508 [Sporomusaceae bacterium FL31]GCE34065.1 hypothetical protein SPFL3102_01874 [Sporomusaceae bacterium]
MSIWVKADSSQVYMNISGVVLAEHVEFLRSNLLSRLQYGYRRITINMNNVSDFDNDGLLMLDYVRNQICQQGGELIIEDAAGRAG